MSNWLRWTASGNSAQNTDLEGYEQGEQRRLFITYCTHRLKTWLGLGGKGSLFATTKTWIFFFHHPSAANKLQRVTTNIRISFLIKVRYAFIRRSLLDILETTTGKPSWGSRRRVLFVDCNELQPFHSDNDIDVQKSRTQLLVLSPNLLKLKLSTHSDHWDGRSKQA